MTARAFVIRPLGEFALRESATFGFGQRMRPAGAGDHDPDFDGVMRLAFCLDGGFERQVGVEVRQYEAPERGAGGRTAEVHCIAHGAGDLEAIRAQTARMLSLDHDARGFAEVGRRDPVIRRLQVAAPGLRPPLFHSPYEAAAWSVLSARRSGRQMHRVRTLLSEAVGRRFELAGERIAALPTPQRLLRVGAFPGIDAGRLERLHEVARAAADGLLEADRLAALGPAEALADVQRIKGIGPVSAMLIVVRGVGFTDALPADEPRLFDLVQRLYALDAPPSSRQLEQIAAAWQPWRTWTSVLVRAVAPRVFERHDPAMPLSA